MQAILHYRMDELLVFAAELIIPKESQTRRARAIRREIQRQSKKK